MRLSGQCLCERLGYEAPEVESTENTEPPGIRYTPLHVKSIHLKTGGLRESVTLKIEIVSGHGQAYWQMRPIIICIFSNRLEWRTHDSTKEYKVKNTHMYFLALPNFTPVS